MESSLQTSKRKYPEDSTESLESKKPHNETFLSGMSNVAESTKIGELNITELVNTVMESRVCDIEEEDEPNKSIVENIVTICEKVDVSDMFLHEEIAILRSELREKDEQLRVIKNEKKILDERVTTPTEEVQEEN